MTVITPPDTETVDEAERELRRLAEGLNVADPDECLYCYLVRVLEHFGCDNTLCWTERWRDQQPTPYGWLIGWVRRNGGFCDCEVLFNVFDGPRRNRSKPELRCAASHANPPHEW
jgi:uncharacterized protein DUF2695